MLEIIKTFLKYSKKWNFAFTMYANVALRSQCAWFYGGLHNVVHSVVKVNIGMPRIIKGL